MGVVSYGSKLEYSTDAISYTVLGGVESIEFDSGSRKQIDATILLDAYETVIGGRTTPGTFTARCNFAAADHALFITDLGDDSSPDTYWVQIRLSDTTTLVGPWLCHVESVRVTGEGDELVKTDITFKIRYLT